MPRAASRTEIVQRLPIVLAVRKPEAAAMIGVAVSYFDRMISEGIAPKGRKLGSVIVWPVDELRACVMSLPEDGLSEDSDIVL